jgi:hypothetical protein
VNFLRTAAGDLIALVDVRRIYTIEHSGGGYSTIAVMRDDELVELARDYSIDRLAKALDPVRR